MAEYYNKQDILEVNTKNNLISDKFCIAKLKQSFIYLHAGLNHSCYHTRSHPSQLSNNDPSQLHNTLFNKIHRKKLFDSEWPADCLHCSKVEERKEGLISDRMLRNYEDWGKPISKRDIEKVNTFESITPSYVEISFDNTCNLQCSYCSPVFSTKWVNDLSKNGLYRAQKNDKESLNKTLDRLKKYQNQNNPFIAQFWKWLPDLYPELRILRITGGEPLISNNLDRLFEWILNYKDNKMLDELSVNTNLSVPSKNLHHHFGLLEKIAEQNKAKEVLIFSSIDSWGAQVEYSRLGLDLGLFESNLISALERYKNLKFSLMVTYNIFAMSSFSLLIEKLLEWRERFPSKDGVPRIQLDIPILSDPKYLSSTIATDDLKAKALDDLQFFEQNIGRGIEQVEADKFRRIVSHLNNAEPDDLLESSRAKFYSYIQERDKRKNLNFLKTFPEYSRFYKLCEQAHKNFPV